MRIHRRPHSVGIFTSHSARCQAARLLGLANTQRADATAFRQLLPKGATSERCIGSGTSRSVKSNTLFARLARESEGIQDIDALAVIVPAGNR